MTYRSTLHGQKDICVKSFCKSFRRRYLPTTAIVVGTYLRQSQVYTYDSSCCRYAPTTAIVLGTHLRQQLSQVRTMTAIVVGKYLRQSQVHTYDNSANHSVVGTHLKQHRRYAPTTAIVLGTYLRQSQVHTYNNSCRRYAPTTAFVVGTYLQQSQVHTYDSSCRCSYLRQSQVALGSTYYNNCHM